MREKNIFYPYRSNRISSLLYLDMSDRLFWGTIGTGVV